MKDFVKVVKTRKSIRSFSDKRIDNKLLFKILELATFAPTSCNQQLWNFIIIEEPSIKDKLINIAASNTMIGKSPVLIVMTYDSWNYKEAIQAASMATNNILLASNYYGVGSIAINSFGSEKKVKKILNIPENQTICCFILLGYPDEKSKNAQLVPRKPVDQLIHWNKFVKRNLVNYNYNPEDWSLMQLIDHQKYYSRKTYLGKEMDLYHNYEKDLIRNIIKRHANGKILDILTYDGSYLSEFPENSSIVCLDLCKETSDYSKESISLNKLKSNFSFEIYDKNKISPNHFDNVTMFFKAERLSNKLLNEFSHLSYDLLNENGKLIFVYRRNSFLFSLYYKTIKILFGNDIRKTGIYSFFGPYKPLKSKRLINILRKNNYNNIKEFRYFLIPPFYENLLQMYLQYKKSDGSSYLHRTKRENYLTRLMSKIIKKQGIRRSRFGSVSVVIASK